MNNRHDPSASLRPSVRQWSLRLITGKVSIDESSRGEEGQTSTRGQAEQLERRDYRQARCRKPRHCSEVPRCNGPVSPGLSRPFCAERPTWPSRPSWPCLRHVGGILDVPKDLGSEPAAHAAHAFHMVHRGSAPVQQAGKCASARKLWRVKVCYLLSTTTGRPLGTPVSIFRTSPRPFRPVRAGRRPRPSWPFPGGGKGLNSDISSRAR